MAITVKENTGTSFGEGWKQVTISTAKRGDYNGSGFIDLWFDNYPETLKCRVWEARGQDGQEFSVSNMVRSCNPDVLESSEGEDGKKIASLDDSPASLKGRIENIKQAAERYVAQRTITTTTNTTANSTEGMPF